MKFYKILFSSVFVLLLFSCKKVIDVKETDFISADLALKTVQNNQQAIIGAYGGLGIEMSILFNAIMSDEIKKSEFYNAATVHEWQFGTQDVSIRDNFTAFPLFYRVIDRVNKVLVALPTADSLSVGDSSALRSKLKGEALFLRAFCHFELYRFYCGNYDPNGLGMAYMEVPSREPQARINAGPYFQKLNADLAEAKTLLPSTPTDIYRANSIIVAGLQARVALYTKTWQNAVNYSTEYINAVALAPRTNFQAIWTDANNLESAFKLKRTTTSSGPILVNADNTTNTIRMGSLFRGTSSKATGTGIGVVTWAPSDKLWNSYDQANDIRFSSYLKDEPLLVSAGRPSHVIAKYAGTGYATSAENVADNKILRTGEMYLVRAEARAELGSYTGANSAESDINALRAARINGYTNVSFASKQEAIDAIVLERFKELAFEGHRLWDLRRYNLPVSRLATDAPTTTAVTLPAGNFRFVLPIPFSELQANPLIQQNPGYN